MGFRYFQGGVEKFFLRGGGLRNFRGGFEKFSGGGGGLRNFRGGAENFSGGFEIFWEGWEFFGRG